MAFDPDRSAVAYGGTVVARAGTEVDHDRDQVAAHMKCDEVEILVAVGAGSGEARMIGIDLGPGYIKENVKTS